MTRFYTILKFLIALMGLALELAGFGCCVYGLCLLGLQREVVPGSVAVVGGGTTLYFGAVLDQFSRSK